MDAGFVVSTEAAIDELMEEDLAEAEMEEEQALVRSAQAGSEQKRLHPQPLIQQQQAAALINPAAAAGAVSAEQDEADFYRQLLATERAKGSGPVPTNSNAAATPTRPSRSSASRSRAGTGAGMPRSSPSPRHSPEPASSPSSASGAASRALSASMQRLQLHSSGGVGVGGADSWNDKLARAQETERRRHAEHLQLQQRQAVCAPPATPFGASSPSLQRHLSFEHAERPPSSACAGLKLPRIA